MIWNRRVHFIDKNRFRLAQNKWASARMSAAERASKASSAEQVNEWAVRAIEQLDERIAQHSTRQFYAISTQNAVVADWRWWYRWRWRWCTVGWICMNLTRSFHWQKPFPHELISEWANERSVVSERSEQYGASEWVLVVFVVFVVFVVVVVLAVVVVIVVVVVVVVRP